MIGVMIIPTGLGAVIGGNAGDGNPAAKLIAQCCDTLITHPNVVNASDINEMTENTLYVEGSMLDRFLEGDISLRPVKRHNKILVVANPPITQDTVNAVSAARATIGANIEVLELTTPLRMIANVKDEIATGIFNGSDELLDDISSQQFDALAIHTPIEVDRERALNYYRHGGVNPWGGVEARLSKMVSDQINKPVAHAPMENVSSDDQELLFIHKEHVEPRIAAEAVSVCYLHCVLKGLHRAPQIGDDRHNGNILYTDVDFLLSPFGCWGRPHKACRNAGIPIIMVEENTVFNQSDWESCVLNDPSFGINYSPIFVANYLEAAGLIMSIRAGISSESVREQFSDTNVIRTIPGNA